MPSIAELEKDPAFLSLSDENKLKVLQGIKGQLSGGLQPIQLNEAGVGQVNTPNLNQALSPATEPTG